MDFWHHSEIKDHNQMSLDCARYLMRTVWTNLY